MRRKRAHCCQGLPGVWVADWAGHLSVFAQPRASAATATTFIGVSLVKGWWEGRSLATEPRTIVRAVATLLSRLIAYIGQKEE